MSEFAINFFCLGISGLGGFNFRFKKPDVLSFAIDPNLGAPFPRLMMDMNALKLASAVIAFCVSFVLMVCGWPQVFCAIVGTVMVFVINQEIGRFAVDKDPCDPVSEKAASFSSFWVLKLARQIPVFVFCRKGRASGKSTIPNGWSVVSRKPKEFARIWIVGKHLRKGFERW